jgi:hypothetical protein
MIKAGQTRRVRMGPSVLFPGRVKYTTVDACDYKRASATTWWPAVAGNTYYARCRGRSLHRVIARAKKGEHVDHIDGNGMNNRRKNLRRTTRSGNERNRQQLNKNNTSGVSGVCKAWGGRWTVRLALGKRGADCKVATLDTLKEAAEVRRVAEVLVYEEHAPRLRKPATGHLVGKFKSLNALMEHYSVRNQRARKKACA